MTDVDRYLSNSAILLFGLGGGGLAYGAGASKSTSDALDFFLTVVGSVALTCTATAMTILYITGNYATDSTEGKIALASLTTVGSLALSKLSIR